MADLKISALPASSTPLAGTEVLPIVQSATTRQVSVANLTAGRAVSALSLTSTNDATINGVTVGRGGGSVSLNTAVGANALAATSTGDSNAAFGASALASNLAGTGNTATGFTSLRDNTSGNYNVASGYLALATNLSGANNVGIGYSVLSTATATSNNTAIGYEALKVASGSTNTAIGYQSGVAMTTGTKNVILGSYSGNTGTLDIRISNNNIVLSDGDGNVRAWWDNANARFYGTLLATGITNSALTSGRVTYAGTSGVLQDNANFTYNGTALTVSASSAISGVFNRTTSSGATVQIQIVGSSVGTLGSDTGGNGIFDIAAASSMFLRSTGASSRMVFSTNNAEAMTLNSAGNLGLGVTPSAWSVGKAMEFGNIGNAVWGVSATQINITQNAFFDGSWKYAANGYATRFQEDSGAYIWNITPNNTSGPGAGPIAFTAAMTLDTSGNLLVGTSSALSQVARATVVSSSNAFVAQCGNGTTALQTTNTSGTGIYYPAIFGNNGNTFSTCGLISVSGSTTTYATASSNTTGAQLNASGIEFPATQVASANANTLDDYEEGTWTPTDGSGAGLSLTVSNAVYIKIGQMVYVATRIVFPVTASAAVAQINGLPFTTPAVAGGYWGGGFRYTDFNTFFSVAITPSATDFTLFKLTNTQVTNVEASGKTFDLVFMFRATA
jgi:hypothetical protein